MSFLLSGQNAKNAKYETVTLEVAGVCEMCKARIETTTYDFPGVKKATWNVESGILTATISPKKTSRQKIADALAAIGYRSELAKADQKAYQNLPACCQYDSGIEKH
jgi:copper chaperone CopZ